MSRWLAAGAVAAACLAPAASSAQDTEWNRYTLEDLGGVFIRIEANAACEAIGVTASSFEAATSLRLIESEVGVLTREEMLEHPALPELRVSFECAGGSGDAHAYVVSLRVQQAAQMLRDNQINLSEAVTWYTSVIGVTTSADAAADLQDALDETLTTLVEAWTAANAETERGG